MHDFSRETSYIHVCMGGMEFQKFKVFIISLSLLLLALAGARAHAEDRFEAVHDLQQWKMQTDQRLDLEEREKDLRIDFINRLSFQVERKYQEGPLRDFLLKALTEMIETDELSNNQSFGSTSEFLSNLKISLATLIEKNEAPLSFIENFTEFSGISEPASSDEFSETRSYYDGKNISAALPMSLEEAANLVDQKETELAKALDEKPTWSPFHQNLMDDYQPPQKIDSKML